MQKTQQDLTNARDVRLQRQPCDGMIVNQSEEKGIERHEVLHVTAAVRIRGECNVDTDLEAYVDVRGGS